MKRFFLIIAFLFCLISMAHAELYTYPFPFTGKWNPTEDPALLDQFGLQDIQNLRKWGKHFRGVLGHSPINTDEISGDSTYYKPRAGFHFKKDNPSESHILIQAFNPEETASRVYDNTTIVPNKGDFSTTAVHNDASEASVGRFASVPQGNVVYCNGKETLIWGGNERSCHGFLIQSGSTNVADFWEQVSTNNQNTYVTLAKGTTFYVGSTRRFDKAKFYIRTANTAAATMTVSYYTGWSWVNVSGGSDGTSSGGRTLAQTGTVSWTHTASSRTTFVYNSDDLLYWYRFEVTGADATTAIYWVTVGESKFRPVDNIWDGTVVNTTEIWYVKPSGVSNFTDNMNSDPPTQDNGELISAMPTTNFFLIAAAEKLRGLDFRFAQGLGNINVAGVTVQYFNGSGYSGVTGLVDGTASGNTSFAQNGKIHWLPNDEWGQDKVESKTTGYSTEAQWYYYKVFFNTALTNIKPYYIRGIPAQAASGDTKEVGNYRFSVMFQNRLFLFNDDKAKNKIRYSAADAPDVLNGDDAGTLYVGDSTEITAAGVLYNVFINAGYEQLIITKGHSTYRLYGKEPKEWILEQISDNIGCVAPLSFVVGEVVQEETQVKRNVALWQAAHGYVACDGATIQTASEDVGCYWDTADSRGIARHRLDNTVAWYDPDLYSVKLLISSGAETNDDWGGSDAWDSGELWGVDWANSITVHNRELEYSLRYKEWTKIYREDTTSTANPLQIGFMAKDLDNKLYSYGATDKGIVYRLENTETFDKQPIEMYLRTGDIMPGTGQETQPFFNHSVIEYIRLLYKNKTFTSGETVEVTHWGDGVQSTSGSSGYLVPSSIGMASGTFKTKDAFLGPNLRHSFKFRQKSSTQKYGMELLGLGLWYSPYDAILGVEE